MNYMQMEMEMEMEMHEAAEKDLHALERLESVGDQDPNFIPAKEDEDLWLDRDPGDLLGVDDHSSIFYTDFPALPDFPCVSSSSSSSPSSPSHPPKVNTSACLSSASSFVSSSLWNNMDATVRENEQEHEPLLWSGDSMEIPESFDPQIDVDCINVMQELGDMDLLDTNGIWESVGMEEPEVEQQQKEEELPSEDLGMMFLEWLKSNKESISAEDLRSIKLKRSTIECAAQRLGGGKEGMTQLLKLILEWVQNHHLHRRRMRSGGTEEAEVSSPSPSANPFPPQNCFQNPNPLSLESNLCYSSSWVPQSLYADQTANVGFPPMMGYTGGGGDPGFGNGARVFCQPDYPIVDGAATWATPPLPQPHFPLYNSYRDQNIIPVPPQVQLFGSGRNHYPSVSTTLMQGTGERLVNMGPSATKEARKKRMARQKRFLSHHRSQNQNHLHHHQQQYSSSTADQEQQQEARIASDANCTTSSHDNPVGNWAFWPSSETTGAGAGATTTSMEPSDVAAVAAATPFSDRPTLQPHHQRQFNCERRQGLKQENNLKFLLQKVLKQSDVGNLGRIVLPKKEAEMHLPELEARDGISIAMEDIVTSRIWNMRYRFWPNNKSRMYLLENTGDFVRSNGLQEGDFIVIYSDVKFGKYMIRGVKVPQQGCKMEPKRGGKQQRNLHATLPSPDCDYGLSSSSPRKEIMT